MVQRRATRFVTNNYRRTEGTVTGILNNLKWESLQDQRKNKRLAIMHKIHSNDIAIPIPDYVERLKLTKTRQYHPLKFRPMKVSKNMYEYSFFPNTISKWNELPASVESRTIDSFKTALEKH